MLAFFIINSANAGTSSTPKEKTINKPKEKTVYLSKETHCRFRKKDKKTYCTDKNNKRITGEIRRYADGEIVLSIPVKNGLIDGKITSNDVKGNLIYTKEYKKGIQEGIQQGLRLTSAALFQYGMTAEEFSKKYQIAIEIVKDWYEEWTKEKIEAFAGS